MSVIQLDVSGFDKLQESMKNYQGDTERAINDVLTNEAGPMIHEAVQRLIPVSGRTWKGKKKPAKIANSLMEQSGNLSITVKTRSAYSYLYFPDDGTNTKRHAGNQQFFKRGGESQAEEIINRCVNRLINVIED